MKLFQASRLIAGVVVAAGLTACSKTEQSAAPAPAPAQAPAQTQSVATVAAPKAAPPPTLAPAPVPSPIPVPTPSPAAVTIPAPVEVQKAVTEVAKPAAEPVASAFDSATFKLPDFQSASTGQLATTASQLLTSLGEVTGKTTPASLPQVEAVKSALSAGKALEALAKLRQLGETVKAIPGAEALLIAGKQVVSAWALKQGFDPAKISGVLGSLQKGDWMGLAAQAASLLGKGGVSGEQKGLLDGVLGNFGVSSETASAAAGALKSLFGK